VSGPDAFAGLRGEQIVCARADDCAARLAATLALHLRRRLERGARVHLALSGGSSGQLLCAALAKTANLRAVDWARIHVWQVDERWVEDGDPRRNVLQIRDGLASVVPLSAENLHPMPVLRLDGAERYERELRAALGEGPEANECRLDAVVLGMGADGHTASLFPGTPALEERERWIVLNDGESVAPPRPRLTMTYPLLNQARLIALLVTGAGKQAALRRAAERREDYRTLPVLGVLPAREARLLWFLDQAAMPG